jgi:hypothetical protein
MNGAKVGGAAVLMLLGISACNDTPTDPKLSGGAGIRFTFPAGTESVRVELWDQDYSHIPAPDCPGVLRATRLVPRSDSTDFCTRMSVHIWNWIGQTVVNVPDTTFDPFLAWDQRNDRGEPVPSGIYKVASRCLDSRGSFTFDGYYYVPTDEASCEWILWSKDLSPAQIAAPWSIGPFDTLGKTFAVADELLHDVTFLNPFLVRVHAARMQTFEQEIVLKEGEYTQVPVTFTPLDRTGAIMNATRTQTP